jgi:hypothetical protein
MKENEASPLGWTQRGVGGARRFNAWHSQWKTGLSIQPPHDPATVEGAPAWASTGGSL